MAAQHARHTHTDAGSAGGRSAAGNPLVSDNYYRLLNVPYTASKREITHAYRQAMMRTHPDRARPEQRAAAEDLAKLLNRAYATLSDPRKRQVYDQSIRPDVIQDEIMNRYVGSPGMGAAHAPRREMSDYERRDLRRSDRSAMISLLSAFAVVAIVAIGILLLYAIGSLVVSLAF